MKKQLLGRNPGVASRRAGLLKHIAAHPGSSVREINEGLWGDRRIRRTTTQTDLKYLAKTGLVTFEWKSGKTRRPTKVYHISDLGRTALSEALGELS
jgi:predicted ArsR family transcriptional regulator